MRVHPDVDDGAEHRGWRRVTPGGALMAMAAILVAGVAARDSAVQVTTSRYPELALKLAPANATAIGNVFDDAVRSGKAQQNFASWIPAAKQALRADPLNAKGLRLLAYATEMAPGDQSRARDIMQVSERASRRDMLAQLWLIEDAVQRKDTAAALSHYDRALSVRPSSAGLLVPVLVSASSEPEIQQALVPYLRADRSWVEPFLSVAIAKSPDPITVAQLFERYGGARAVPRHAELETRLIQRLVLTGRVHQAQVFASAAGAALTGFGFSRATTDQNYRPLTWALYEGADGRAEFEQQDRITIEVDPEKKIIAASRTIVALPGAQVLGQRLSFPAGNTAPLVTWKAYCRRAQGPERFWTRDIPVTAAATRVEAPITIPGNCAGVQFDIEATGTEGLADSRVTIDQVRLSAR